MFKCYDCGTEIKEFVLETRQVSGGDGVVYTGDFREVPIHRDRQACRDAQREAKWKADIATLDRVIEQTGLEAKRHERLKRFKEQVASGTPEERDRLRMWVESRPF